MASTTSTAGAAAATQSGAVPARLQLLRVLGPAHVWGLGVGIVLVGEYMGWNFSIGKGGMIAGLVACWVAGLLYTCVAMIDSVLRAGGEDALTECKFTGGESILGQRASKIETRDKIGRRRKLYFDTTTGTLLGYQASDWLLASLGLAALLGLVAIWRAIGWLRVPPATAVRQELRYLAQSQPRVALAKCHERVRDLLELADSFYRGERV